MTEVRLRQRSQTSIGWQFLGQLSENWPPWVRESCTYAPGFDGHPALRCHRASGAQIVYWGEWLVRDLDGGILWYTPEMLAEEFETDERAAQNGS